MRTFCFVVRSHPVLNVKPKYRVALNFCGSLILRIGDFLCFAGTTFCDWKRLVFLAGN